MSLDVAKYKAGQGTERPASDIPAGGETQEVASMWTGVRLRAWLEGARTRMRIALQSARGESKAFLTVVTPASGAAIPEKLATPEVSALWRRVKRAADIALASVLLLLASPVMAIVAASVGMTGSPVLFRQSRVGKDGRIFQLVKFRSMVPDAEEKLQAVLRANPELQKEWDLTQKLQNDPRITRLGLFLRRSSLDELPQLLNVLAGDMSIVGPRPVVPDELERYGAASPWYLAVRPGVTGLWQVSGRNDTSYARRVSLDVHYVRSQKLWLDAFILVKTAYVVLLGKGAH